MVSLRNLWRDFKWAWRHDVALPVLGRLEVAAARLLIGAGRSILEAGIHVAMVFDGYVEGGIRKRRRQLGRSTSWLDRAMVSVRQARALDEQLHPRPRQPAAVGDLLRGLVITPAPAPRVVKRKGVNPIHTPGRRRAPAKRGSARRRPLA